MALHEKRASYRNINSHGGIGGGSYAGASAQYNGLKLP